MYVMYVSNVCKVCNVMYVCNKCMLIDWLWRIPRSAQEFFTFMECMFVMYVYNVCM
jgi:hypothetical protein